MEGGYGRKCKKVLLVPFKSQGEGNRLKERHECLLCSKQLNDKCNTRVAKSVD